MSGQNIGITSRFTSCLGTEPANPQLPVDGRLDLLLRGIVDEREDAVYFFYFLRDTVIVEGSSVLQDSIKTP